MIIRSVIITICPLNDLESLDQVESDVRDIILNTNEDDELRSKVRDEANKLLQKSEKLKSFTSFDVEIKLRVNGGYKTYSRFEISLFKFKKW